MNIREFYKELYYKELERRENYDRKLNHLIPLTIVLGSVLAAFIEKSKGFGFSASNFFAGIFIAASVLFILLGKKSKSRLGYGVLIVVFGFVTYYMLNSFSHSNLTHTVSNFLWIIVVVYICILVMLIYLLGRLTYNYYYSFLPLPKKLEKQRRTFNSDNKFESYITRRYIQGAEQNTNNNDQKSAYLHKVYTIMILAFSVLLISVIPYFYVFERRNISAEDYQNNNKTEVNEMHEDEQENPTEEESEQEQEEESDEEENRLIKSGDENLDDEDEDD